MEPVSPPFDIQLTALVNKRLEEIDKIVEQTKKAVSK